MEIFKNFVAVANPKETHFGKRKGIVPTSFSFLYDYIDLKNTL